MEGALPMMVRELPHTVGVILYLSSGAKLPNLSGILQEIGILCRVMPSNFCMFVGVGEGVLLANPLSMMLASFVLKRYYKHNQVKVARSIEQAITLINASCGDAG
jgi:hydroxymethylpyrimidine pyrophosphatase-like HAD family hydrolase